nr:MAG TPA_asm: hypothetical protein [Caudoviricetes sp.]
MSYTPGGILIFQHFTQFFHANFVQSANRQES